MVLECNTIRDRKLELYKRLAKDKGLTIGIITVGNDYSSKVYVQNKIKTCNQCGIGVEHIVIEDSQDTSLCSTILSTISKLNRDNRISGIILQLPIANLTKEDLDCCLDSIDPNKDIDCLCSENKISKSVGGLLPCTVQGVLDILDHYKINVSGRNVVILGRSDIVGKPLRDVIESLDGTVTVVHSKTVNREHYLKEADIVISAVGKPNLFSSKDLSSDKKVVVVDVGISRATNDATKICGDFDTSNVSSNIDYTPVPKGVGLLTTVNVVGNVLFLHKRQLKDNYCIDLLTLGLNEPSIDVLNSINSGESIYTPDVSLKDDNYFNALLKLI